MHAAIVAFDGFDELDTFVAVGVLDRLKADGWSAEITSPAAQITSMSGATVRAQRPLEFANDADVVLFAGGLYNRAIAEAAAGEGSLLDRLTLDPLRQTIGASCAGTLMLARLGLLGDMPACTDAATRPWLMQAGVLVLDEPFHARGPIGSAGGPMAAVYLAAWVLLRCAGADAARRALRHAAPVGEQERWLEQVVARVSPFVAAG